MWKALALATLLALNSCGDFAFAFDHGFDKNDPFNKWVGSLKVPPQYVGSCCGFADMYEIKIIKQATGDEGDAMGIAVVTDGEAKRFPDGANRAAIPNGTKFKFPKRVVNTKQGNPTFNAFAFLGTYADEFGASNPESPITTIYCVIPEQQGL